MRVLAGDIGGSNARLAIVDIDDREVRVSRHRTARSADYPGLTPIVREFLAAEGTSVDAAGIGIAGPVVDGSVNASNLPWRVSEAALARETGLRPMRLLNDLEAIALGVGRLRAEDLVTLQAGEPAEAGTRAVIAAGTGLGEATLVREGADWRPVASEGGHCSFAARSDDEWAIRRALAAQFGHVSSERLVSGPGLLGIYRILAAQPGSRESDSVRAEVDRGGAMVVSRRGVERSDPLCSRALDVFISAYGAVAGDLALTVLATGGVYVAGGIAPAIVSRLADGAFMHAFCDKGRLGQLLARVPVHVVMNTSVGLIGAALAAFDHGARAGTAAGQPPTSPERTGPH